METRFEREKAKFEAWLHSPEYQEKLTQRLKINDAALRNKEAQVLARDLCKNDILFFIENFGWTFDPRPEHAPHHLPFILFEYQKRAILWIKNKVERGEDGLVEKSRDMGVTWIFVWVFYWFWLFSDTFSGLKGSYKEALVDNRTKDSLFGMLDYAIENTPRWLLPKRFKPKEHRQKLKLTNPENFNLITGDTMNPDFGRGSRKTVVFFDEGASWEYFKDAWESAGDVTPCRITVSTPKGRNAFAILRESGVDVLTLHWKDHPIKDQEWYEFEKGRRTEEEVAQELDISYHKSQEGRVYPEWDNVEYGEFPYDDELPLYISWDFGFTDDTAIVWWQVEPGGRVRIVDCYSNRGKTIDFYVPFVTGVIPSEGIFYSKRDLEIIEAHKYWKKAIHYGDPAGRFTNQVSNISVLDVLRNSGIYVNFREEAKDFQSRKNATKLLLRNLVANNTERVKELGLAMENSSYPKSRSGGQDDIRSIKPLHNWCSHYRSAVEYFAVNYELQKRKMTRVYDKFQKRTGRTIGY